MTKKTILVLTIIVALIIAIYKWLTSDNEEKQPVEETKAENNEEQENVKPEETTEEVKENGEDTVNETINK